jgi:hypothetical protein
MSLTRIKTLAVGFVLALTLANAADAQYDPPSEGTGAQYDGAVPAPGRGHPGLFTPFIDPGYFHSDFQFFAPPDFEEYGNEFKAPTGWFGTYDRMYVWITRARQEINPTSMDHTWGNRFDWGFMTEEQHGWLFSVITVDGPNANNVLVVERLNQVDITNPPGTNTNPPVLPTSAANDPFTNQRTYNVTNSLNNARISNFEVNKMFRLDPSHNGTFLEPFLGVRYTRFADFTVRQNYARYDVNGNPVGALPPPDPATALFEQLTSANTQILNDMFGGQLGFRVRRQASRWNLSGEMRAFAMQNFQALTQSTASATAEYSAIGVGI